MKKFSIITVCLNEPQLERTCKSIVNQIYQNFEWIVIDGGSNSETLAIFNKYKQCIDYFISEKDNGIYDAMNKGITQATGVWLYFMNAGDYFAHNNVLSRIIAQIDYYCDIDIFHGKVISYGNGKYKHLNYTDEDIDKSYFLRRSLHHQACFIKADLFYKFGYYRTDYRWLSDFLFTIKLCFHGCKFFFINILIAYCDNTGVTSIPLSAGIRNERKRAVLEFYNEEEIEQYEAKKLQMLREKLYKNQQQKK
jgi:glycosyltransferase involved in cell wall biosynthesis